MTTTSHPDLYDIPQEFLDFRDLVRQIAQEQIAPRAGDIDRSGEYPWDIRKLLAEQDILGLPFSTEYGGTGTGTLMLQMAVEEIAKACASSALILMIQELGSLPIALFGNDEQKHRFLPRLATGEISPAFALSEPEAGSDPASMRTHAVKDGDDWIINGHEELDHQRRDRRLLRRLRQDRPREQPDQRVHRRVRPRRLQRRQARAQARHQGLADRVAGRSRTCACPPRT